jgi:hypothetical protein
MSRYIGIKLIGDYRFHQVKAFLNQQCIGHRPKKSKVFTRGIASVALQQLYSWTQVSICSYLRNMEDGVPVGTVAEGYIEDSIQNKFAISKQILSGVKEEETFENESKPSTSTNKTNTEESTNFVTSDGLLRLSQVPVQFVGLKNCHFHFNCKDQ